MKVKNFVKLNEADIKSYFDEIDNVILDVDGVVWDMLGQPLDGIPETLKKLNDLGKNIYFASNNNMIGFSVLLEKLQKLMPDLTKDKVITPSVAIISYLNNINFNKEILIYGSSKLIEDFIKAGFVVADGGPPVPLTNFKHYVQEVKKDVSNVGAVYLDYDINLNVINISKILNCLRNEDVLFITGLNDRNLVLNGNTRFIGTGDIEDLIFNLTNRKSICFGKPQQEMKNFLFKQMEGSDLSRSLIVGDMLDVDIPFGKKCGFKTLLTLTGVSKLEDLEKCNKNYWPDYYIESLGQLYTILDKVMNL